MDSPPMKVVWKSVVLESGELCVMTFGAQLMLRLYAGNLDFQTQVYYYSKSSFRPTCRWHKIMSFSCGAELSDL